MFDKPTKSPQGPLPPAERKNAAGGRPAACRFPARRARAYPLTFFWKVVGSKEPMASQTPHTSGRFS